MKMDVQKRFNKVKSIFLSAFYIFLLLLIRMIWNGYPNEISIFEVRLCGWISIVVFLFIIYEQKRMFGKLFNLLTIFSIAFFVFSNGELILIAFKVPYSELNAFYSGRFLDYEIAIAGLYNNLSLLALNLGMTMAYRNEIPDAEFKIIGNDNELNIEMKTMRMVGIFLVIISVPFDFYDKLTMAITSGIYGYHYLYSDSYIGINSIFSTLSLFCIPGCLLLSLGFKNNKIFKWIPIGYLILRSLLILFAGKRGQAIGLLVGMIWFIYTNFKKVNKKISFKLIVLGYIALVIMSSVVSYRSTANKSILGLLSIFISEFINVSVMKEMINEMGFSIRPLLEIMRYHAGGLIIPKHGMTYLFSFIMIIPSFLRGSLYNIGLSNGWVGIEEWLTNSLGSSYGLGFSLQAESYYNFGSYGWLVMIVFGSILCHLMTRTSKRLKLQVPKTALNATLLSLLIISARSSSQLLFKYITYYYYIPLLLLYLVKSMYKRNFS